MEQRKKIDERKSNLEKRFLHLFDYLEVNGKSCFRKENGVIFSLTKIPGELALVVEYAVSYEEAILYRFEDGDRFYLEDMDEDTMFQAMLREIGQ